MLDPTIMKDWQIAEEAEKVLPSVDEFREKMGLLPEEIIPYGRTPKLNFLKIMDRLKNRPDGKFIEVTAITPTPLGEGKSTTSLGIIEGLGKRGVNVGGCLRQPSGGPTMNIKGTAAGGGNALLIPMTEFSLGLTGDINDITNAHNLAMVALNARMQHEANYDDEQLAERGLKRLDIDPEKVEMGWVIDFAAQCLRNIEIGIGGPKDGFQMKSRFGISVSSELMAILAVARDLKDLRKRISEIIVAYDKNGNPVTTADLQVDGAMTAWMRNTINPTLCYTVEHQPCLVHAGPFANIAIGQSSIIGDRLSLKMFDYHVTESGFAAVRPGQMVEQGQMLVGSVRPDHDGDPVYQGASGEVVARVEKSYTFFQPFRQETEILTGACATQAELYVLGRSWGNGGPALETAAERIISWEPVRLGRLSLPACIRFESVWPRARRIIVHSAAQARALAHRACRDALLAEFPDAVVEAETCRWQTTGEGEACTVTYRFCADIATPVPPTAANAAKN